MSRESIEATQSLFEAFGARNFERAMDFLDPEVVIEFYGTDDIPYAGTWRGHAGARRFFETVHAAVEIHQFEPQDLTAADDKVFVTGHLRLTAKPTGKSFESDFAHVITLRDARWIRFRDFMNTALAAAAFRA